ncbi:fumarate reductase subunit C [Psychromonas sp. CD1]|uniref:fumarate reductase subunit C n=1 Tax=Psychromonas sp. CD1 TaxID=1979839 RepID=UPI000B9A7D5F|nr:fumarate reductase subunit C [Psychromonas sp. CD1]
MSKRKPYIRKLETNWWLKTGFYTRYMLREGSCIFITLYSLILTWGIFNLSQGESSFNMWLDTLQNPFFIILHLIVLIFALYHSITWFALAPKAIALWVKGTRIEDSVIIATHYAAFAIVTVLCLLIITL